MRGFFFRQPVDHLSKHAVQHRLTDRQASGQKRQDNQIRLNPPNIMAAKLE